MVGGAYGWTAQGLHRARQTDTKSNRSFHESFIRSLRAHMCPHTHEHTHNRELRAALHHICASPLVSMTTHTHTNIEHYVRCVAMRCVAMQCVALRSVPDFDIYIFKDFLLCFKSLASLTHLSNSEACSHPHFSKQAEYFAYASRKFDKCLSLF